MKSLDLTKKTLLISLLILAILCSIVIGFVACKDDTVDYEISEDGIIISLSENAKKLTSIVIPNEIDGKKIKGIGEYAFASFYNLQSVELPSEITSIENYAFSGCSSLTNIDLPNGVIEVGAGAFSNCTSLTNITLPSDLTSINDRVFYDCNNLKSIVLPSSLTNVEALAFYNCSSLTSLIIPSSVTSINCYAFEGCSGLENLIVENGNDIYKSEGNCIIRDGTLVLGCKNSVIPNYVNCIGEYAFYYCDSLTSIKLPNSIISIESGAFYGCSGLTYVTIPSSVIYIGSYAFNDCKNLSSVTFENTDGWYYSGSSAATSGTSVLLNMPTQNATYLKSKYSSYYWKCNA